MSPESAEGSQLMAVSGPVSNHASEMQVLFLCSRVVVDSRTRDNLRTLLELELDWDYLIQAAGRHRVMPLFYRALSGISAPGVPERPLMQLRKEFHANAKKNLLFTAELLLVLDLFKAHRIRAVCYKGPVLAAAIYGDTSMRQFSDLDVIVPLSSVEKARELLISRGYKDETEMSRRELQAFMQNRKDLILIRHDAGLSLELHWGFTHKRNPIQVTPQFLWEELRTFSIYGKSVQLHAPEALLIILCIHGGKHRWEHLGWLCDIAEVIRSHESLDWNRVIDKATKLRGRRIVLLGLSLARNILGAKIPPDVVRVMESDTALAGLSEQVKDWICSDAPVPLGETERYFMKLREHRGDRFRVAMKQAKAYFALTTRDTEAFPRLASLSWPLYIIRPFRLAREYGLIPLKRFFKGIFESW